MEPASIFLKISKNMRGETCSHLMEEGAVCHGDPQPTEAHAQNHVIRSVIAVASAAAQEKSPDGFPAKDHAGRSRQKRGLEQCCGTHLT